MTVEMHGFDLDIRATGIIHSTGEQVVFTIQEATNPTELASRKALTTIYTSAQKAAYNASHFCGAQTHPRPPLGLRI